LFCITTNSASFSFVFQEENGRAAILDVTFFQQDCPARIDPMQRKVFWILFLLLGLIADFTLPLWWALASTIPILVVCWWVAYRSDWF